jgi:uncharacterized protein YbjT (DUF2867 family)
MKIAVAGGTGVAGRSAVKALRGAGHEVVVISRAHGIDLVSGKGLDAALSGVQAVIDASSQAGDQAATLKFFRTSTENLIAAERRAGVTHHVLLSIVGVDRGEGNAHYQAKRLQEQLVEASPIPYTIQRASQFFEFADTVMSWMRQGDTITVPPLLLQPIAVSDVGKVLAEVATGKPQGRAIDIAGPETQDLVDMLRRILSARGDTVRLVPSWHTPLASAEATGDYYLPGPEARLLPTTFDRWLETVRLGSVLSPRR